MEYQDFSSFINDRLRDRGISLKRVSEVSGIPINFLESLIYGDEERLPPAPYLRAYLVKLGRILGFEPEPWWQEIKSRQSLRVAGPQDKLPQNRFALKTTSRYIWFVVAVLIILGYVGFRFYPILGKPQLMVAYPGEAVNSVGEETITVWGDVGGGSKVFVNREEIAVEAGGMWQKRIQLQPGLNTIEITAKKFLGGETRVLRQVVYEPGSETSGGALREDKQPEVLLPGEDPSE